VFWTGFVQSLEFLKKSQNLASNFPDLQKVWKIEMKSGKMVKKMAELHKCIFLFSLWSNLLKSRPYVCSGLERKVLFLLFKFCIDHLFDNLQP